MKVIHNESQQEILLNFYHFDISVGKYAHVRK